MLSLFWLSCLFSLNFIFCLKLAFVLCVFVTLISVKYLKQLKITVFNTLRMAALFYWPSVFFGQPCTLSNFFILLFVNINFILIQSANKVVVVVAIRQLFLSNLD